MRWDALFWLALVLAGSSFALQGRSGINLADEGFLWYGVQRTAAGEVPLRDFQSYDPGRYYWCAPGTFLFGKGLVALRFSEALFQALGLWAGLLAARRLTHDWKLLALAGVTLTVWMFPSHKLFDHSLLLTAILVAVRLIEQPSRERIFVAGGFIGLCTFFGRNHALYSFMAIGALLLLLCWKARREVPARHLLLWCCGLLVGSIPLLAMIAFVPGFYVAYSDSLQSIFRNGANLGLPVPWLWRISYSGDALTVMRRVLLGVLYLALPLFYLCSVASAFRMNAESLKKHALLVACSFIGLVYAHHAFARADLSHMAQAIHPFTLGVCAAVTCFSCPRRKLWIGLTVFAVAGLVGGVQQSPAYQRLVSRVPWLEFDAGKKVFIPAADARFYNCLRRFADKNLSPHEPLLIAPFTPGLYPILDRPSPLWELYFFFSATAAEQKVAIEQLGAKRVNWALVSDATLDRRDDLRFAATHKSLSGYLRENFQPVRLDCLPKGMKFLRRKAALPSPNEQAIPSRATSLPLVR